MYIAINLNESTIHANDEKGKSSKITNALKRCVSNWSIPEASTLPCISLLKYYPGSTENLTARDKAVQHLIWAYKACPPFPCTDNEILRKHKKATNFILPYVEDIINHYFKDLKKDLTLVCVPASQKKNHRRRFKDFSLKLCELTRMQNGYNHVRITKDGEATRFYFDDAKECKYVIDKKYFYGRNILLCDDIVTSGATLERMKKELEKAGANVIGAITIGKTCHK